MLVVLLLTVEQYIIAAVQGNHIVLKLFISNLFITETSRDKRCISPTPNITTNTPYIQILQGHDGRDSIQGPPGPPGIPIKEKLLGIILLKLEVELTTFIFLMNLSFYPIHLVYRIESILHLCSRI